MIISVAGAPWDSVSVPLQSGLNNVPETIYRERIYVTATTTIVQHGTGLTPDRIGFEPEGTNTYYTTDAQRAQWNKDTVTFTASGTGQYVIVSLEKY